MDAQIRDAWADALESGKYKQGREQLRTAASDKFCCLGVLCDLAVKAGVIDEPELIDGYMFSGWQYDGQACLLPSKVREWAGNPRSVPLMNMNDNGKSFKTIAKYIRENL